MNAICTLALAALVLPHAVPPAMAHNADPNAGIGVRAPYTEFSQSATGVPAAPRPDTSIPERIIPAHSVGNEHYREGIGGGN